METPLIVAMMALAASLGTSVITYRSASRSTSVQQQNADTARVTQLRNDLTAAEAEVSKMRRQVAVLTREAEGAAADLVYLRRTIWRQGMTLERLREFVGPEVTPAPDRDNR